MDGRRPTRSMVPPRGVGGTRRSEDALLGARPGTREQARFFLERQQRSLATLEERHGRGERALQAVDAAIPARWRRSRVDRGDLSRYVFEPNDIVVTVGQDGLVANTAKYLAGQPV